MNTEFIVSNISRDLKIGKMPVKSTVTLLQEGATIPFIARYRKERTDGLDENQIRDIFEKYDLYAELEKRKDTILKTIASQGKLDKALEDKISRCTDKNKLEDLYLPYKPKRRTRATIAREKGLDALAELILKQETAGTDKAKVVAPFVDSEKGVTSIEEALSGARDIIAETISDNEVIRGWVRDFVTAGGKILVKAKKEWREKASKFQNYYDYSELLRTLPSHRMLAIQRGEAEGVLSWALTADEEAIVDFTERQVIKKTGSLFSDDLKLACSDSVKNLLFPSIENEAFAVRKEWCEKEAIRVFSTNLKNLLLAPPAGSRVIMGVDPGYRTGCKAAVIDRNGDYKEHTTIFPLEGSSKRGQAADQVAGLIRKYGVELVAVGNGTASKETEAFVQDVIEKNGLAAAPVVVSEAGASVYSASKTAVKEFPDLDVTIRGAVSIARRLQDPLAELVKIDPKSIGVGQYQHDVNQQELKHSLDLSVESCVNRVGVELNTASTELLSYVSGIGPALAENIAGYRSRNGSFKSRKELLKVEKLGPKAFELCAGFLRIRESGNPLDNSAIHPETYGLAEQMARDEGLSVKEMIGNTKAIAKIDIKKYVTEAFGLPTLADILNELKKPGLDPRKEFRYIRFSDRINGLDDLGEGMILDGTVTNVTNFGAFVDIGVHQDGLIHISKLGKDFVKNPYDVIAVGDIVKVKVLAVDVQLKRISLERVGIENQ